MEKTSKLSRKEFESDWSITAKILGYCQAVSEIDTYRVQWGLEREFTETLGGNELYISPEVIFSYFHLTNGVDYKSKDTRQIVTGKKYTTTRNDSDLEDMLHNIDRVSEQIAESTESNSFEPNHKNCYICKYNVLDINENPVCTRKNPKVPVRSEQHIYRGPRKKQPVKGNDNQLQMFKE